MVGAGARYEAGHRHPLGHSWPPETRQQGVRRTMPVRCPLTSTTAIVSDHPQLAAGLSCALARRNTYLPVLDGPRLTRPDWEAEVVRRTATLARAGIELTVLAGLSVEAQDILIGKLPSDHVKLAGSADVLGLAIDRSRSERPRLVWGRDRIGLGLLKALYSGQLIEFAEQESPREAVPSRSVIW